MTRVALGLCLLVFVLGLCFGLPVSNIGSHAFVSLPAISTGQMMNACSNMCLVEARLALPAFFYIGAPIATGYLLWKALINQVEYKYSGPKY